MNPNISNEQFFSEFDSLIRCMPEINKLHVNTPENLEWLGLASALVMLADPVRGTMFKGKVDQLSNIMLNPIEVARSVIVTLQQFRNEYRIKSAGPLTMAFSPGMQFDYFDEVRKILETASSDLLIVDPYLGADFVSRYLPHVKKNVSIRLMIENQITQVQSAVTLFSQQYGNSIEIRKSTNMHDRYMFIDGRECFQSGATFKDGASKSATTLTQIIDAFDAVRNIYETAWTSATIR